MVYAEFDNISEFLDVNDIEGSNSLGFVLVRTVLADVAVQVGEEILVNFIVAEVKNILYSLLHFLEVQGFQGLELDALYVELVVDFFLNVLPVGFKVDQQALLGLLDLLHRL